MNRKRKRLWTAFYGSNPVTGSAERAQVRQALYRRMEPQPKYTTRKYWTD